MSKKTIAALLVFGTLSFAQAQQEETAPAAKQSPESRKPTPEQVATRNSTHLQKMLGLTDDQKQKTYQAILTRTTAIQQIRTKYGKNGDKKAMQAEIKPVRAQFVQAMNGILTPEQKTKWDEHRLKMKENRNKNKQGGGTPPAIGGGGNGGIQKLTDDDDGIGD